MATYNKFNQFTQDLCRGVYNFSSGAQTYNVMLTNTAPLASNHLYGDISANELTTAGGYTAGGQTCAMSDTLITATENVSAATVTWTATAAGIGPFRYVVVYNASASSPLKPLVCWYDYGNSITLSNTDTFTVSFPSGFFQLV